MSRLLFARLITIACLSGFILPAYAELPRVGGAWMSPPPPGAPAAAAYFNVANTSDEALIITGASSELGSRTEVHLSEVVDDVATMREQKEVRIEPGEHLKFEPGSYHVMFMGLDSAPELGQSIPVVLHTNQGDVEFSVPVIEGGEGHGESGHGGSEHSGHDMKGHGQEQQ